MDDDCERYCLEYFNRASFTTSEKEALASRFLRPITYDPIQSYTQVEKSRIPAVFKANELHKKLNVLTSTDKVIEAAGYTREHTVRSFDDRPLKLGDLWSNRFDKKPISIVEDCYFDPSSFLGEWVCKLHVGNGLHQEKEQG